MHDIKFIDSIFLSVKRKTSQDSGGGYSYKNWAVCDPLPKTLTLFMTKICDIIYPIYDLNLQTSKSYFRLINGQNQLKSIPYTVFMSKTAKKTYPLGPHIPLHLHLRDKIN